MKKIIQIFKLLVCFSVLLNCQLTKQGGIYFRVDDNQEIVKWRDYAKIFNKYGYKFGYAINMGLIGSNNEYYQLLRDLQSNGHEMQDHTPNHRTMFFTHPDAQKFATYPGVDHINYDTVCLRLSSFDLSKNYGGGYADIYGNIVISKGNGGFKLYDLQTIYSRIYFPTLNLLCSFSKVFAKNSDDVDTLIITSNWQEYINLKNIESIPYQILSNYDLEIDDAGIELLGRRTLELCESNGISRPYTWIQPGGLFTQLYRNQVKKIYGDKLGFTAGAVSVNPIPKTYNLYDKENDNRFGWDWADFNEDFWQLNKIKTVIADKIAKHYVLSGHSHFIDLLGGWDGYLARMDSLLQWCKEKDIKIKTQNEWANVIYNSQLNPYENIIPRLYVDLDENNLPDGYYYQQGYTLGQLDKSDGVEIDKGYSFSTNKNGVVCEISQLGGLEKGELDFSIWTKGSSGNAVQVKFTFPENGVTTSFVFPAVNAAWTKYSLSQSMNGNNKLIVPDTISFVNIYVSCPSLKNGPVKISGMELHKKIDKKIKITSTPITRVATGKYYEYQVLCNAQNVNSSFSLSAIEIPDWLSISSDNKLIGFSPSTEGLFNVSIVVNGEKADADTQRFFITVKNLSQLSLNIKKISFKSLYTSALKETTLIVTNRGEDTLVLSDVKYNNSSISWSVNKIMPPQSVQYTTLSVTPHTSGFFAEEIIIQQDNFKIDTISISGYVDSINQFGGIVGTPAEFILSQNYPNPFNAGTEIKYTVKSESIITIKIYNMLGQMVKTLISSQERTPGYYSVNWKGDGDNGVLLSSGVYFCRMTAIPMDGSSQKEILKKMLYIR